ncbi:hypothetical protein MKX01_037879 [Papaver californicum]|nr:hypothetical protein MKX01_037879 [Papaver californicum]
MLLNLFERPFSWPVNDCHSSYRRKDHLNRHLLQHQGTLFSCPVEGCNQRFAYKGNAHVQSCYQHVLCEVCGTKQLKKNMKRHMRGHEIEGSTGRIKCSIKGCECTLTKSNLNQHVKSVHLQLRPFVCRFPDCGQRFSFKHGGFQEADEQFQTRPGRAEEDLPNCRNFLQRMTSGGSAAV